MLDNVFYNNIYNIYKVNPISRFLCSIIFTILVFLDYSIYYNIILCIVLFFTICISSVGKNVIYKSLLYTLPFIVICILFSNFNLVFIIKSFLLIFNYFNLVFSLSFYELIISFNKIFKFLHCRKKLSLYLGLGLYFIPVLVNCFKKTVVIYNNKGINFNSLFISKKFGYIISLTINSFYMCIEKFNNLIKNYNYKLYYYNDGYSTNKLFFNQSDVYILCFHFIFVFIFIIRGIM